MEDQSHPWLHRESEDSLGYLKDCKTNKQTREEKRHNISYPSVLKSKAFNSAFGNDHNRLHKTAFPL